LSLASRKRLSDVGFSLTELDNILAPLRMNSGSSIRGPLQHQAHALKAPQGAMKPYAGVTVERGNDDGQLAHYRRP
jgi:hypothetical protein